MTVNRERMQYVPGMYAKRRPSITEMVDRCFMGWQEKQAKNTATSVKEHHAICLSRKIGVGALELADMLSERLKFRVVDQEIIEHIASNAKLSKKAASYYDEHYADRIDELMSLLFREKSFMISDYTRQLFGAMGSLADSEPTIFVGRGAHLVLPRESVLAVRIIGSNAFRVDRLARILHVDSETATRELAKTDTSQRKFFKKVYNLKSASAYEFDIVINRDHLPDLNCAAEIIHKAYDNKFK